ncbi:hypothetical protein AWB80_06898 [Caballeronia pedi]|uniref:Uncharacterized protein n=1 Tax=Caballeronia pedi TaxID=1777141 RepID=A0A158DHT8_9BURK|nr:hypothetical protein [Caballeronia pedi]SAK93970.1 hypothetical protein AWB80_06898 [Caballeronia pedi]
MRLQQPPPLTPDTDFKSAPWQSWFYLAYKLFGPGDLGIFTVAKLPNNPFPGQSAFATNGRKVGEGVGSGTGVPVYFSGGAWRVRSTDAIVTA